MPRSILDSKFEAVISGIASHLKSYGFERQGKVLRAINNGNAAIVGFQRSDRSSGHQIIFTVNTGIVCGDLLDTERTTIEKSTIEDAHLRSRLGSFLDPAQDTWWEIDASTDSESLVEEISQLLLRRAVPYLEQYGHTRALMTLWETGKSPGLTAVQRSRYLSELKRVQEPPSP